MSEPYTPTTDEVRNAWWRDQCPKHDLDFDDKYNAAFDRWLSERDRQAAERAWDEGVRFDRCVCAAWNEDECACGRWGTVPRNPYRAAKGEQR